MYDYIYYKFSVSMALNVKHVHFSYSLVKFFFLLCSLELFFAYACVLLSPLSLLSREKENVGCW